MQSDAVKTFKNFDEFIIGDPVWEWYLYSGKLIDKFPGKEHSVGYLLSCNSKKEYTIYTCQMTGKSGICLVRKVPQIVMDKFIETIIANRDVVIEPDPEKPEKMIRPAIIPESAKNARNRNESESNPEPQASDPIAKDSASPFLISKNIRGLSR